MQLACQRSKAAELRGIAGSAALHWAQLARCGNSYREKTAASVP